MQISRDEKNESYGIGAVGPPSLRVLFTRAVMGLESARWCAGVAREWGAVQVPSTEYGAKKPAPRFLDCVFVRWSRTKTSLGMTKEKERQKPQPCRQNRDKDGAPGEGAPAPMSTGKRDPSLRLKSGCAQDDAAWSLKLHHSFADEDFARDDSAKPAPRFLDCVFVRWSRTKTSLGMTKEK